MYCRSKYNLRGKFSSCDKANSQNVSALQTQCLEIRESRLTDKEIPLLSKMLQSLSCSHVPEVPIPLQINFRLIWSEKKRYYTLILAKRQRSDADLRTCWVKQRNQNHTGFWTNIFWLGHLSFRFIIIEIFGARFWPLWAHLPSIPPTLSYQLSKLHKNVSGRCCRETFPVFTAWSWSTRWRYPTSRMIGHWLTI